VNLESVSVVATEVAAATAAVEDVAGADGAEAAAAEVAAEVEQKETANTDEGDAAGDATGDATSAAAGETPGMLQAKRRAMRLVMQPSKPRASSPSSKVLLFASDKALGLAELKRLLGERDGKKVTAAVQSLAERRKGTGIEVAALSSGWHLRTNLTTRTGCRSCWWPAFASVARHAGNLAIVAYRQPVTRPEVDNIRGVDCGPVLKTLLERGLVRIIGKKEEVGRPMLYGTTPNFCACSTCRSFRAADAARVLRSVVRRSVARRFRARRRARSPTPSATTAKPEVALHSVSRADMPSEPDDSDPLLDELDQASKLAKQVLGEADEPAVEKSKTPVAQEPAPESIPPVAE